MGNIYSSAYRVIAYLGNSYEWGEQALRFVLRLFVFFAKHRPEGCDFKDVLPQTSVDPDDREWQCLRKLLYHPWFQRQWIVQEVLMAPKDLENNDGQHHHCSRCRRVSASSASYARLAPLAPVIPSPLIPNPVLLFSRKPRHTPSTPRIQLTKLPIQPPPGPRPA